MARDVSCTKVVQKILTSKPAVAGGSSSSFMDGMLVAAVEAALALSVGFLVAAQIALLFLSWQRMLLIDG